MATRTAPVVSVANINKAITTLHVVDASGDTFADSIETADPLSDTLVEAWATAYQGATQSSLWKVSATTEWVGDKDADNADALYRGSVASGVNTLFKNTTTRETQTPRLVAPITAVMQGNQDIPLLSSTEMTALITAVLGCLTGYGLQSAQYTGRRERTNNPRISA